MHRDEGVDGGGHAKAAAGEARDHSPRRGAVLDRWLQPQSHAICPVARLQEHSAKQQWGGVVSNWATLDAPAAEIFFPASRTTCEIDAFMLPSRLQSRVPVMTSTCQGQLLHLLVLLPRTAQPPADELLSRGHPRRSPQESVL